MKFKNTKKLSIEKEAPVSVAKKEVLDADLKEEIREIVEETVEDVLKEKSDSALSQPQEEVVTEPSISEPAEEETVTADKESENRDEKEESSITPVVTPEQSTIEVTPPSPQLAVEQETVRHEDTITSPSTAISATEVAPNEPMSSSVVPDDDTSTEIITKRSPVLRLLLLLIVLLLLGGGGLWYLSSNNMLNLPIPGRTTEQKTSPTDIPAISPTGSEKKVDISAYDISVLNGSGISGEAAKVKASLKEAGFTVTSTGNADTSTATNTIISAKSSVDEEVVTKLSEELGKTYEISSDTKKLDESEDVDITVTIGSSTK